MANLTPTPTWVDVYELSPADFVLGGSGGTSNTQPQQLTNRTEFLKVQIEEIYAHNSQAIRNGVLLGKSNSSTGELDLLIFPASTTVRLQASVGAPFRFVVANGYDEKGVIATVATVESDLELSTVGIPDGTYNLIVDYQSPTNINLAWYQTSRFYASVSEPTPPPGAVYGLWYNTATGVRKLGSGGAWDSVNTRSAEVGTFTISGGVIVAVQTFPYRQEYYNENIPAGTMLAHFSTITPLGGYLRCDGSEKSRSLYRALFNAIGTTYGAGNGTTTFNLPDTRGRFIRDLDSGAGRDASRIMGTAQDDELKAHQHDLETTVSADGGGSPIVTLGGTASGYQTESEGGTETRPKNLVACHFIKY